MARKNSGNAQSNRLLAALSPSDLALLEPSLERVELPVRQVLEAPNKPIQNVYFMEQGFASVVGNGSDNHQVEVGIIGREGMSGTAVVIGNHQSPNSTYIQVAGHGQCMPAAALRKALADSPTLQAILRKFVHAFMTQTAYTAIANGRATLEQRLARWLLMAHDRIDGNALALTHEFLALMLGVRRPGVTVALQALEKQGLINPARGQITIVDREGIEKIAGSNYGVPEAELKRLFS